MQPAPWRTSPPVSDALWARVGEVRANRAKAAGRRRSRHVHLLAKLMWCPCGRVVRADTSRQKNGTIARRYVHQGCPLWSPENVVAHRLDLPIEAQLSGIRIDARTLSRIRAGAGRPIPASTDMRRMQLERDLRAKATDHAARRLSTSSYLAEHERITAAIDALEEQPGPPLGDIDEVVGALGAMRDAWGRTQTSRRERNWSAGCISGSSSRTGRSSKSSSPRRRSATASSKPFLRLWLWRARRDSNPRPPGPQPGALSAELRAHERWRRGRDSNPRGRLPHLAV